MCIFEIVEFVLLLFFVYLIIVAIFRSGQGQSDAEPSRRSGNAGGGKGLVAVWWRVLPEKGSCVEEPVLFHCMRLPFRHYSLFVWNSMACCVDCALYEMSNEVLNKFFLIVI